MLKHLSLSPSGGMASYKRVRVRLVHKNDDYRGIERSITKNTRNYNGMAITIHSFGTTH